MKAAVATAKGGSQGKALSAEAQAEAQRRSAALSTSSDVHGVAFRGPALHRLYFDTKFARRGWLLFRFLQAAWQEPALAPLANAVRGAVVDAATAAAAASNATSPASQAACSFMPVASVGGGPGTDAAGLVWFRRRVLAQDPILANLLALNNVGERLPSLQCALLDYEGSWKRYLQVLDDYFGDDVHLSFAKADATCALSAPCNRYAARDAVQHARLFIFAYVCHETSAAASAGGLAFFRDLARSAPRGSAFIFLDVMSHSAAHLDNVVAAMSEAALQQGASAGGGEADDDSAFEADVAVAGHILSLAVPYALQTQLRSEIRAAVKL
jgi:hypothetical protein